MIEVRCNKELGRIFGNACTSKTGCVEQLRRLLIINLGSILW
jgi:hypothetical protein